MSSYTPEIQVFGLNLHKLCEKDSKTSLVAWIFLEKQCFIKVFTPIAIEKSFPTKEPQNAKDGWNTANIKP